MRKLILVGLAILVVGCGKNTTTEYRVPGLMEKLKDSDPKVRYSAANMLGKYGPEARDAVPALTEALRDEDKMVRMGAAYALAEIGPDANPAIPALKNALRDKD